MTDAKNAQLPESGSAPPVVVQTAVGRIDRAWWRWLLSLVVVAPMVGLAYGLGDRAFVFPEGAALAFGVMVVGKHGWVASRWRLLVLPTACAVAGCVLANLPMPKAAAEVLALGFALAVMQTVRGRLGPAVSAAVLPVVFSITTWIYPATVAGICLALVVMVSLPGLGPQGRAAAVAERPGRWSWPTLVLFFVVAVGWIALASLLLPVPTVALAPPLLVAALEWCGHGARPPAAALRRWALLVTAAAVGGAASWLSPVIDQGITPTQALMASAVQLAAVGVILVVLGWTGEHLYPALAIALVPNLVAPIAPWLYMLAVGIGAAALYGGATVVASTGRALHRVSAQVVRARTGQSSPPATTTSQRSRRWLSSVAQRSAAGQARLIGMLGRPLPAQLAQLLLDEAVESRVELAQRTIAAMLGVQCPSINKIFKEFERNHLISVGYAVIEITDPDGLRAHAT